VRGTVLLVEDEFDTRELLARALIRAGYRCVAAAEPRAALAAARNLDGIDIVVTDVVLGTDDRGGLRVLTELRAIGIRAPVIVVTAFADVEKVKFALNHGAAHFLEKPFRASELVDAVERVRGEKGASATLDGLFARAQLTEKERTVARHLLAGLSSNEIADLEHNSPKTIRQHVSQIYAKCGVGSRAEFFRVAYAEPGRAV
jgi:DNA-binding NarL/FixJ family response regulator